MRTKGNSVFQIGVVKKLADNEFHRGVQLGPQVPPGGGPPSQRSAIAKVRHRKGFR